MAKKATHYAEAERLYVQEQMTFEAISEQIDVAERTLRYWAEEANWQELRKQFIQTRTSTHGALYKLIGELTQKAIEKTRDGQQVDQAQLYFIARMSPLLLKIKTYEDQTAPEGEGDRQKKGNYGDLQDLIFEQFGVNDNGEEE